MNWSEFQLRRNQSERLLRLAEDCDQKLRSQLVLMAKE